jgi:malate dehydrogenase (oxaloacetate-decarboxylating)(NADP+)
MQPISGLVPPRFTDTNHIDRCLVQLRSKSSELEKYIYLNVLKERNPMLFYEFLIANMLVRHFPSFPLCLC